MAKVHEVADDRFEVRDFVGVMVNLSYEVMFDKHGPRVISRSGCSDNTWDRHAISAVQHALITGEVTNAI